MKRSVIIFAACLTLVARTAKAQYFEGEIVYENSFRSKLPRLTAGKLASLIGDRQQYYIKDGHYKSLTNGGMIEMQLYDNATNRIYNKRPVSDTLYWFDASVNTDTLVSFQVRKNAEMILGNLCDELIMRTKTGITAFYYSSKYRLDGSKYRAHGYNNWAFYTTKCGALPLKIVLENRQFRMESIAREVKSLKMDESFFRTVGAPVRRSN